MTGVQTCALPISSLNDYYTNFDKNNLIKVDDYVYDDTDLYNFITKYDLILDNYVFERVVNIIPNSDLTYDIINKI